MQLTPGAGPQGSRAATSPRKSGPAPAPALDSTPIDDDAFAEQMARIGHFEAQPLLALAVSGGPDSMAMAWLAARWAKARRGRARAFIVDHGLRPEAQSEARIAAIESSTSWRLTRPIRGLVDRVRRR